MAAVKKSRASPPVYQLRVELAEIQPVIWRTLWVPGTIKLSRLDRVIQSAIGWTNSHLHEFMIDGRRYGVVDVDGFDEGELLDDRKFTLGKVLGSLMHEFMYEYDFGDGWRHHITVQHRLAANEYNNWPVCIAGENAGPPEDVGGSYGFAGFVRIMSDPTHEEHLDMWRWHGGPFDPRGFDISAVNNRIRRLR